MTDDAVDIFDDDFGDFPSDFREYPQVREPPYGPREPAGPRTVGLPSDRLREAARTPTRHRIQAIAAFRHPDNVAYLRGYFAKRAPPGPLREFALDTLHDALLTFSEGSGRAYDVMASDPIAQRGAAARATSLWAEVRRLNRVFCDERFAVLREYASAIERRAPRDGIADDDEDYAMRMFISDSLRPPGLENLNTPGPLWSLRENQSTWAQFAGGPPDSQNPGGAPRGGPGRQSNVPGRGQGREHDRQGREHFTAAASPTWALDFAPGAVDDDVPWSAGDANRTPEQAMAEYWGDNWTPSETRTGAPETAGRTYGSLYAWGDSWGDRGGPRFMRYESIPFWQKGGREGTDRDIEETLGLGSRELDSAVRRMDMDKVRHPRGQEYRRFGPRTGRNA